MCGRSTAQGGTSSFVPLVINASDVTFDTVPAITSTTLLFRKINPEDSLQTFVYTVTLYRNNSVNVIRATDVATS
ncbi:MAG: hypothetical protein M0R38_01670 [Bacteroidia bacterium]|nr:hypothetical protein [Bacteroidia bacterium]